MVANEPGRASPEIRSEICSQLGLLALQVEDSPVARADALVERLLVLDRSAGAIDVRLGRLLSWLQHADLAPLGFSTFGAFVTEWVDLDSSQRSELVRLANCELDLVKLALCRNVITTTQAVAAVRALGRQASAEDQDAWLQGVLHGAGWRFPSQPAPRRIRIQGRALKTVHRARRLASLVVGSELQPATADRFVLDHWRAGTKGEQILDEGRQPRPAPEPAGPWPEQPDPAEALLGPWVEPTDVFHAAQLLARVLDARRRRALERGRAYRELVEGELYRHLAFSTAKELVRETLQVSQRTLQEDARLALELELCPGLAEAIGQGLDLDRALLVLEVCDDDTAEAWIEVARRTGKRSLRALVQQAQQVGQDRVLEAARRAMSQAELAARLQAQEIGTAAASEQAQEIGSPAAGGPAPQPVRPVRIDLALAHTEPPPPDADLVDPDLPTAARWFLDNVRIPKQPGFQVVRERARFTCSNPECRRRTLRCDAHHIVFRSQHGPDDPDTNGLCVCRACHLRLIHTGRVRVDRVVLPYGPATVGMLWTWPDRRVWVA